MRLLTQAAISACTALPPIVFSGLLQYITTMLTIFSAPRGLRPALKTAAILITAAIVFSTAACKINPTPPDRYALVYGISIYDVSEPEDDGDGPNLVWTDNDAVDMAKMLHQKGYEVRLRINDGSPIDSLSDAEESMFNLAPADENTFLDDLAYYQNSNNIERNDIFLFYFSGHGTNSNEFDVPEDEQEDIFSNSADEYLVLPDYDYEEPDPPYDFITDNFLGQSLDLISATKKIVILDSCFSGGFIGQRYDVDRIQDDYSSTDKYKNNVFSLALTAFFNDDQKDVTPNNAIVLTASGESENSLEPPAEDTTFENGFFTEGLLHAASLGDYNNDGYISALEMYRYANSYLMNLFSSNAYGVSFYEYAPHISGGPVDYVLFEAD